MKIVGFVDRSRTQINFGIQKYEATTKIPFRIINYWFDQEDEFWFEGFNGLSWEIIVTYPFNVHEMASTLVIIIRSFSILLLYTLKLLDYQYIGILFKTLLFKIIFKGYFIYNECIKTLFDSCKPLDIIKNIFWSNFYLKNLHTVHYILQSNHNIN